MLEPSAEIEIVSASGWTIWVLRSPSPKTTAGSAVSQTNEDSSQPKGVRLLELVKLPVQF